MAESVVAPTLTVAPASGDEDSALALLIDAQLVDPDGTDTLSVIIAGVPAGATLSAGTLNPDGTWTLTEADLAGLTITPAADSAADFNLIVTAITTDDTTGEVASTSSLLSVTVDAVADAPSLITADVSGDEDTAIALNISSALTDTDGSESLSVLVAGVPAGATLSAGTLNPDGTWTLSAAELAGLTLTPAPDSDADFTLTIVATSTEGENGVVSSSAVQMQLTVNAVADGPQLVVSQASGGEDSAIALSISATPGDADGSEITSVIISGVPADVTLSAGTLNADGTWTLAQTDLAGLTLTPAQDSDADFNLIVTAISTEGDNGSVSSISATVPVTVDAVADAPNLSVQAAAGSEDTAIALDITAALTDMDGSETLSIVIAGVPAGATLSAGTLNPDGTWTLSEADLTGLTITPAPGSDADFNLIVTAISTESENGSTSSTSAILSVAVDAIADAPSLTMANVAGDEDAAIALNISSALTDTDGSETLSIVISGVPAGATLSAGTLNPDGTWTLTQTDLTGLTITPVADNDADFTLTIVATSTEGENGSVSSTTAQLSVTVDAVADAPDLSVQPASGSEDTAIALSIAAGLTDTDGSETLSIVISGVPAGATLSAGTLNADGTWTLTEAELTGLTLTPAPDSDAAFNLIVTAISTDNENGSTNSTTSNLPVTVDAVADAPTLTAANVGGDEDTAIALNISSALTDTDGSESLSAVVAGVPAGATLSAGTLNADGTWTLTEADLAGLTLTPAPDSDADFGLTVTAVSTEGANGSVSTTSTQVQITVNAVADSPQLVVASATGSEDTAIPLSISATPGDSDGSETLSIIIAGVPAGAALSAGTLNADGTWTLTQADLTGLTLTPVADSGADFNLMVTVISTEGENGSITSTAAQLPVTLDAVADAPTVTAADASGNEDTAIPLQISAALTDTDGSESLSVLIAGVPAGATLSAGTLNPDDTWTLTEADLSNLTLTPVPDSDADFSLTVTAVSTEGENGSVSTTSTQMQITVNAAADAPNLTVTSASGSEDGGIPLSISASPGDTDGSESLSIVISGVPAGASLSAGTLNPDGTWTLTQADFAGLTLTPAPDSDVDFNLIVTAISTEGENGSTSSTSAQLSVTIDAVADAPALTATDATGDQDTSIALNISSALTDADGSESLSILVAGVPAGATLSAGTLNPDGTWTLTAADLTGLTVTPAPGNDADFSLTITSISTEGENGDSASTTTQMAVTVNTVAAPPSPPTVTVVPAHGDEDTAISLSITISGTEAAFVTVGGLPTGATLSAGTLNADGTWTLTTAELEGLTLTPAPDSDEDFTLTVTATSGGGQTSDPALLDVTVDGVVDAPELTLTDGTSAAGQPIDLNIDAALTDTDGSEILTVTIDGVPNRGQLSAGTLNPDGTWTLAADELAGLQLILPGRGGGDFTLTVTATSAELANGDTTSVTSTMTMQVEAGGGRPTIVGGGSDRINVGNGDTIIDGAGGNDRINAGDGDNVIDGGSGSDRITVDDGNNVIDGGTGNDRITADDGNNVISGGTGSDRITVDDGNNVIDGGTGNDRITADDGDNVIDGGTGSDRITVDDGNNVIDGGTGNDRIRADDGDNVIDGGAGNDRITVDDGDNVIFGGSGSDRITAGDGNNVIFGGSGDDRIRVGDGSNFIDGGSGNDRIEGGRGDDILFGGPGNDRLEGGRGDDLLVGGTGNDRAFGESGNDTYVFGAGSGEDYFNGGRGGWLDSVELKGVEGDPSTGDWSLDLTRGEIVSISGDSIVLSEDAAGTITISNDGSELTFEGVEQILF